MMAEAAADPALRKSLAARSLALVTGLLMLAALGIVVLAPYILLIFGKDYTGDNITLLRLLVLSAVPWGLTTIYISLARSVGKTGRIAIIQITTLGLFFLTTAMLFRIYGVIGIGFAWLASHSLVLAAIGIVEIRKDPWRLVELLLVSVSASARLLSSLRLKGQKTGVELAPSQASAAAEVMAEPASGLIVRRVTTFDNDCETLKIEGANATNCVYLKRATTPQGRAALARHVETIARLREDIANTPQSGLLPDILFDGRGTGSNFIIQRSVSGIDGREFLKDRPDRPDLLARVRHHGGHSHSR
ncbi:hypothetical protein LP421_32025 (plasmid) [Rhizobium sp. RCAM05350]|nr:hypothetical protein LP421_32025 [Rhizobium sp. RCAM05350]